MPDDKDTNKKTEAGVDEGRRKFIKNTGLVAPGDIPKCGSRS